MNAPHIAIVSPNPAKQAGGVERVCALLAQVLEQRGWRVTIIGPQRTSTQWEFRFGLGYLAPSRSASQAAQALHPDLIISNGYLGMGGSRSTPRIHLYHGTMVGDTRAEGSALPVRERLRRVVAAGASEAFAAQGATSVICVSEAAAEELHRYYRICADAVVPNGIDTSMFTPRERMPARERLRLPKEGRYALFVGRRQHRKGADLIVAATQRAGYELLVAGATEVPGARHLGVLAPAQLVDAYAAVDCVLFPSRYEACSLVVLEALACGRPLLTTRVGWMRTLLSALPDYDRLCVEPTVEDLYARLRELPSVDTAPLTSSALAFVRRFNSLEHWSQRWYEIVERALKRNEQRPADSPSAVDRHTPKHGPAVDHRHTPKHGPWSELSTYPPLQEIGIAR